MIRTTSAWWTNHDEYWTKLKSNGQESTLETRLGFIKRRGDSKFQWVALPNKYREDWPVNFMQQGICFSEAEAKKKVESFWPVGTLVDVIA